MSKHSSRPAQCCRGRLVAALLLGLAGAEALQPVRADSDKEDQARYQVIIDRAPFGAVTGTVGTVPGFAERLMFVGLVPSATTNQPLAVLYDSSRNRSDLVGEGDTVGEVKVLKVDVQGENSSVTIQHGLDTAKLTLKTRETPLPGAGAAPMPPVPTMPGVGAMTAPGQPPAPAGTATLGPARRRIPFRRGEP